MDADCLAADIFLKLTRNKSNFRAMWSMSVSKEVRGEPLNLGKNDEESSHVRLLL